MAEADAKIRPYVHQDDDNKLVRFMVGKSRMEPLAVANFKATTHPWILAIWVLLSSAIIQTLGWWPKSEHGRWGYLSPLPALTMSALPLMFIIDWYQRSTFEEDSVKVLARPDIVDIQDYYARSPLSGVWIYEFGHKFVGLIAIDASMDSVSNQTVLSRGSDPPNENKRKYSKGTSNTATIRHCYTVETFRSASAQDDLISFAVKRVFGSSNSVDKIRISPSPLSHYLGAALRKEGFEVVERGPKVGLFGWTTLTYELSREKWKAKQ